MKIAHKITALVVLLIVAISGNAFFALRQVTKISDQFRVVMDRDFVLTEICNAVTRNYLQNALRFQALFNAGDELAFAQMPDSRRQYLRSHVLQLKESFARLTQSTGSEILRGKDLIMQRMKVTPDLMEKDDLEASAQLLKKIEGSYIAYDQLFNEMVMMIESGKFELSIDDLNRVHLKEKALSERITTLLEETRRFTQKALRRAAAEEALAKDMMLLSVLALILVSILTSMMIINSFSYPLKNLVAAAKEIGRGNFKVVVDSHRADEVGEVGAAFNVMTRRLGEFKMQLEEKNEQLAQQLNVTKEQKLLLEKTNKELDQFAHTVSHDIAQPLTGIVAYSAILEDHYAANLDERARRSIAGIHKSAARLSTMIHDLLSLSKISRLNNPYEKVDCQKVFDEVRNRLEFVIVRSQAQIQAPAIWPVVTCDRIKLTEVFYNLLSNAIKFSSLDPKMTPQVMIGYREDDPHNHIFSVKDNGVGIAQPHHKEIFEVFTRLESSSELEGTGTGLAIAKTAIEDQGGRIWVESSPGEGAVFYFTVPKNLVSAKKG